MADVDRNATAPRDRMPKGYESEATRFLRELVENNPGIEEERSKGRSMYWDRPLDSDEQRRYQQVSVRQKAYVYDPQLRPKSERGPGAAQLQRSKVALSD